MTNYTIYAHVDEDDTITRTQEHEAPPVGPLRYVPVEQHLRWPASESSLVPKWINGAVQWVETASLAELRQRKMQALSARCAEVITSGFMSSALGEEHHYPAKPTDQSNLTASVTESLMPGLPPDWSTSFWCVNAAGVWEMRAHTAAQIQQVGRDGKATILAAIMTNESLRQLVAAAATAADIDAIGWPNE